MARVSWGGSGAWCAMLVRGPVWKAAICSAMELTTSLPYEPRWRVSELARYLSNVYGCSWTLKLHDLTLFRVI